MERWDGTNSSPGLGGSMWPWERAEDVERGWNRAACGMDCLGKRNDWRADLGVVDALNLL